MNAQLKLVAAFAIALAPITAHAGGLAPAIEETPPIVIEDVAPSATSSVSNFVVPLVFLGLVGLAAASSSGGGSSGAKDIVTSR